MLNACPSKPLSGITARAVIIGLAAAVLECLIAPYNDYVIRNIFLAGGHFPVGPFFIITVLSLFVIVRVSPATTGNCHHLVHHDCSRWHPLYWLDALCSFPHGGLQIPGDC